MLLQNVYLKKFLNNRGMFDIGGIYLNDNTSVLVLFFC